MLEVSTLRSPSKATDHHVGFTDCCDEFMAVDDDSLLLDYIDFTSCDVPCSFFDADGDILPDLEVDPTELLAEFEDHDTETKPPADLVASSSQAGHDNKEELSGGGDEKKRLLEEEEGQKKKKKKKKKKEGDHHEMLSAVTTEDDSAAAAGLSSSDTKSSAEGQSKKTKTSKNSHGKRKVDWTPELHRKFVQAVEQLGIDKAVPSRILEIMGIECLTRHNIASHLQKYRSHMKHLMAREAEAASWAHKRQMYAAGAPRTKVDVSAAAAGPPWPVPPTIGFPPPFCRPLHVWGHPPTGVEAPLLPVWPRHLAPPHRPWAPAMDPASYWHHHLHQYNNAARRWGPQAVTQGTPCSMPPPPAAMLPRFPPVPGMTMPHPMYRPIIPPPHPPQAGSSSKLIATLQLQLDAHPSMESIDAAIGDVLVKPWLPLPLGLKPPSLDSVMSELHKQGIPKIPPPAAT